MGAGKLVLFLLSVVISGFSGIDKRRENNQPLITMELYMACCLITKT